MLKRHIRMVILMCFIVFFVLTCGCHLIFPYQGYACPSVLDYNLRPVGWTYSVNEALGVIYFYPLIENIGTKTFCGNLTYTTGVYVGSEHTERTVSLPENLYDPECKVAPHWSIKPGEIKKMDGEPLIVPYNSENSYSDLSIIIHSDKDECTSDDWHYSHWTYTGAQLKAGVKQSGCLSEKQYRLKAAGWSASVNEGLGKVYFYPIIENVGTKTYCGNLQYTTGVYSGSNHIERTGGASENPNDPGCTIAPSWSIDPGAKVTMDDYPLIVGYHPDNIYSDLEIHLHGEKDDCVFDDSYKSHWTCTGAQLKAGVEPGKCKPDKSCALKPVGWTYSVKEGLGNVYFYPIIENVGTKTYCGNLQYTMGVYAGSNHIERTGYASENPYDPGCTVAPSWSIDPGKSKILDDYPLIVAYSPGNVYRDLEIHIRAEKDGCVADEKYQAYWTYTGAQLKAGVNP